MPSALREQRDRQRKEKTRQTLLRAAQKVFARKGYHKTLVSDIVAAAGVGQGTFYRSFRDKRHILQTLLEEFLSELLAEFSEMEKHLPENATEYRKASIDAFLRATRIVGRNRRLCLFLLREAPTVDDRMAELVGQMYDRFARRAQFYLDHAIARGFARPCRTDLVAQAIVGVALRTAELWLKGRYGDVPIEEIVVELVNFAFQGFASGSGAATP